LPDYTRGKIGLKDRKTVKAILTNTIGPFPERTPLNARVTGVIKKDGYRIEKVIYESMPTFYVTACLFIPDDMNGTNRKPAIVQVSGHGFPAFRSLGAQKQDIQSCQKGFIVFAIDPLGQGERIQYWDNEKKHSVMGSLLAVTCVFRKSDVHIGYISN